MLLAERDDKNLGKIPKEYLCKKAIKDKMYVLTKVTLPLCPSLGWETIRYIKHSKNDHLNGKDRGTVNIISITRKEQVNEAIEVRVSYELN